MRIRKSESSKKSCLENSQRSQPGLGLDQKKLTASGMEECKPCLWVKVKCSKEQMKGLKVS